MPHHAPSSTLPGAAADPALLELLKRVWGYDAFLPNQAEAVDALMNARDSLVILPTGGGKSLCFQLPALAKPGMAVVVSPLLALMKDQVDALVANGVAAASLNSSMSPDEKRRVMDDIRAGRLKLLYLSPERLAAPDAFELLAQASLSFIAIDEAHCVSQWGHEFRPDYRNLAQLRAWFPEVSMHAFTATATPEVRDDIIAALGLKRPDVVVGSFDRPNLFYRAEYRRDLVPQVRGVLDRHPQEAGIIYCIRRADVESLCATLQGLGYRALPYHAGLSSEKRRQHQDAFSKEEADLIVATVAFGMGIDRSNVRFVIHTGMPKSIEHYQQEAGRAGRDRLAAECVLFYGAADPVTWRSIQGAPQTPYDQHALDKVGEMYRFCRTLACRHRFLVSYFGEAFEATACGACDVCLGEHQVLPDSTVVAQKILSCVVRVQERFGARHVAEVLKGSKAAKIVQLGHDKLSTHGLLADQAVADLSDWIDQLVGHGYMVRSGDYQVLKLTPEGRSLLKGEGTVQLTMPRGAVTRPVRGSEDVALDPAEEQLFQDLRAWRKGIAQERGVPPYLILGDATLRELASRRPASDLALRGIKGIGETKARDLGARLLEIVQVGSETHGLTLGGDAPLAVVSKPSKPAKASAPRANPTRETAFEAFAQGRSLAEVAAATGRAVSTLEGYLMEYLQEEKVTSAEPWVDRATYDRVLTAASELAAERLRPIYEALGEEVSYGAIRISLAVRANQVV